MTGTARADDYTAGGSETSRYIVSVQAHFIIRRFAARRDQGSRKPQGTTKLEPPGHVYVERFKSGMSRRLLKSSGGSGPVSHVIVVSSTSL